MAEHILSIQETLALTLRSGHPQMLESTPCRRGLDLRGLAESQRCLDSPRPCSLCSWCHWDAGAHASWNSEHPQGHSTWPKWQLNYEHSRVPISGSWQIPVSSFLIFSWGLWHSLLQSYGVEASRQVTSVGKDWYQMEAGYSRSVTLPMLRGRSICRIFLVYIMTALLALKVELWASILSVSGLLHRGKT